jgi:hypothetical protein
MDRITEEKIKSAANVVDVIEDFLTLKPRGVEYVCLCPFHDDKTLGNFSVNPTKGVYKCFACGAGGDAIKFLMEYKGSKLSYGEALHYLAKKYSIPIPDDDWKGGDRWQNIKPAKPKQIVEMHKEMLVMERDVVRLTMKATQPNIFIEWLRALPWNSKQRERLPNILWQYCVGRWGDRVCFWQIDEQGRPRGGKLMRYGMNGKRDKDKVTGKPGWMHNQEGIRERCDMEHHEYRATLFGMHLLKKYPEATINIVESEKTALICSTAYGNMEQNLWMACGGLEFLKLDSIQTLIDEGRTIWIWPDKDGVEKWRDKVSHILSDKVRITTKFLDDFWIEADGAKTDVADIILRLMTHPETANERKRDEVSEDEKILLACQEWTAVHGDEPFLDPAELIDPRVREWRDILRRKYNFNKSRNNQPKQANNE